MFLPIIFVEGFIAEIFKDMALTVAFSLLCSLIIALTLVPMLSSKILNAKTHDFFLTNSVEFLLNGIRGIYERSIKIALRYRVIFVILFVGVFVSSLLLIRSLGAEFLPSSDEGQININVEMPEGTKREVTNQVLIDFAEKIEELDEIDSIVVSSENTMRFFSNRDTKNIGYISLKLKPMNQRNRTTQQVGEEISEIAEDFGEAKIEVKEQNMQSNMFGESLVVQVFGDDLDELEKISSELEEKIQEIQGVASIESSIEEGESVYILEISEEAKDLGINGMMLANFISTQTKGTYLTDISKDEEQKELVQVKLYSSQALTCEYNEEGKIKLCEEKLFTIEEIYDMVYNFIGIPYVDGGDNPVEIISDVAPKTITHKDATRYFTIDISTNERDLQELTNNVTNLLDQYEFKSGYSYQIGGESQQLVESFDALYLALTLAIIIVFMILASQFESLVYPISIMMSIPLSITGGLLALALARIPVGVTALIGFLILFGIVINNAIVLIDFVNQLRQQGKERKQAIIEAGKIRLRPILMTMLTTVLAVVPLLFATSEGSELERPLALVVAGGLTLATILTLVVVPTIYTLFDDLGIILKKLFNKMFKNEKV